MATLHCMLLFLVMHSAAAATTSTTNCTTHLEGTNLLKTTYVSASSEKPTATAANVYTTGWCAATDTQDQWVQFTFPAPIGVQAVIVAPLDNQTTSYPTFVHVQYIPNGQTTLQEIPVQSGLSIAASQPTITTNSFGAGQAVKAFRFILKGYQGHACMKVQLIGCPLSALCPSGCQHGGICVQENRCDCMAGYTGATCEQKACQPAPLGLGDGRIPMQNVQVSSEDPYHSKNQIGIADATKGWCASFTDKSPWVQVKLDKPMAVSKFVFQYISRKDGEQKMYTKTFNLQYVPAIDKSGTLRSYADNIPCLNGTHHFDVTIIPQVVTDVIRIVPNAVEKRACFKLELHGCDPKSLCSANWCMNGGKCMGNNVCSCPAGFVGARCDQKVADVTATNLGFVKVDQQTVVTTTYNFTVTGHVSLQTVNHTSVLTITGTNNYITLPLTSTSCLTDIDHCTSGFTVGIDINFGILVDNTFLLSSGGNLPGNQGIALFYNHNSLTYIVSSSTQQWTLVVPYPPVTNQWQHFEITWNKNLGIELLVNGHVLGSAGRPANRPATQQMNFCVACSHTSASIQVNMQIKDIHTWSLDRTELVNAGLKPTPVPAAVATTTPVPGPVYQQYNLTFLSVINNLLVTPAFNFTLYNKPHLDLVNNSHTILTLDCSKNQYIELPDKGIPCIEQLGSCANGFTFKIQVQFTSIDIKAKTYIISSGSDVSATSGLGLYIQSNQLTVGVKEANTYHWAGKCDVTNMIKTGVWYAFEVSWSHTAGVSVVIDGYEVINETQSTPSPASKASHSVLIGKAPNENSTSCMKVRDFFTWTIHREVLVEQGILKAVSTRPTPASTTRMQTATTAYSPGSTLASSASPDGPNTPSTQHNSTTSTSTTSPTPITVPQLVGIQAYQFTFISIDGNILITKHASFQTYGKPLILKFFGIPALILHGGTRDYIEIKTTNVPCLDQLYECKNGFTYQFTTVFSAAQYSNKTHLISTGGEHNGNSGAFLYYEHNKFYFGYSFANVEWKANVAFEIKSGTTHEFLFSWNPRGPGVTLIIDGKLEMNQMTSVYSHPISNHTLPLAVGKGNTATIMIYGLQLWPFSFETLVQHNIIPAPITMSTTTSTTSASTIKTTAKPTSPSTVIPQLISYNASFISIVGNVITTPSYQITAHGNVELIPLPTGGNAIMVNSSNGAYIEIAKQNITCITTTDSCRGGFTISIGLNIVSINSLSKVYIITGGNISGGSSSQAGFYLYYQNHTLHYGATYGHFIWTAQVTYKIDTHLWYAIEFTLSQGLGPEIYINGTRLNPQQSSNQTIAKSVDTIGTITAGKVVNNSSNSSTSLLITGLHFWPVPKEILLQSHRLSSATSKQTTAIPNTIKHVTDTRTNSVVKESTTHGLAGTAIRSSTQKTSLASSQLSTDSPNLSSDASTKPATGNSSSTKQSVTEYTTQYPPITDVVNATFSSYEFKFTSIDGNVLHSGKYTLTAHGNPTLVTLPSSNAVKLNSSQGQYIEFGHQNITCLSNVNHCSHGFTMQILVNILLVDTSSKTYIISSGRENVTSTGIFLYYYNHSLYFGYANEKLKWSTHLHYELSTNNWHTFQLSWSRNTGIALYINGTQVKATNTSVTTNSFPSHGTLMIGHTSEITYTTLVVTGIKFWPVSREILVHSNVLTSAPVSVHTVKGTTHAISPTTSPFSTDKTNNKQTFISSLGTTPTISSGSNSITHTGTTAAGSSSRKSSISPGFTASQSVVSMQSSTQAPDSVDSGGSVSKTTTSLQSNTVKSSVITPVSTVEATVNKNVIDYFNLGFTSISGNLITAGKYQLTAHGNLTLVQLPTGEHAIKVNSSKGEYIQIHNPSITCIDTMSKCDHGLTAQVGINFITHDNSSRTYIISSGSQNTSNTGLYLYYLHNSFHVGFTFGTLKWSAHVKYEITTNAWHTYQITWSQTHGIALYVDGKLLVSSNVSVNTLPSSVVGTLTIGKSTEVTHTTLVITGLQIWSASREILLQANALTTTPLSTVTMSSSSPTTKSNASTTADHMKTTEKLTSSTNGQNILSLTSAPSTTSAKHSSTVAYTKTIEALISSPSGSNIASATSSSPNANGNTPTSSGSSKLTVPTISSSAGSGMTSAIPTHLPSINNTTLANQSTSLFATKVMATTETSTVRYSAPHFNTYTFGFTTISGQVIIAGKYTLEAHGNLTLVPLPTGEHAIKVNTSKGEYIQIHNQNITCIDTMSKCDHGLTVQIGINFITHENSSRTYIISSGSQNTSSTGLYLYYLHNSFHFGFTFGTLKWSASVKYEITTNVWHTYQLTWSHTHGIALYVDGKLLTSSNSSVNTLQPSVTGTLTIGKSTEVTHTTLMITGLQIWSASREILLQANILTTTLTTTHSSLSTTNVGTHSTAGSIKTTDMLKSSTHGASWKSTSKAVNTNTPPMKTTDKVTIATNGSTTKLDTYTTAGSMKTTDMLTSLTHGASGESTSTTANTNTAATTTGAMKTTDKVTLSTNGSNMASSTSSSSDASASTPSSSISTKTTETILSTNEHNSASVTASSIASVTPTTTGPTNPIDASVSSTRPNISSATSASSTGSTLPQTPTHMISIPANSISSKSTSVLSTKGSVTSETSTAKFSKPAFHTYNFSFTNISGQVIIAGKYTLEAHGNLTLVQLPTGQHAIKVNTSKGEYIQFHNQNITCIDTMAKCNHGLTVQIGINFITHDNSSRTYIISSGSQNTSSTGLYLYYLHNSFHFGFTFGTLKWSASVKYEITTNVWHTYQLTWSHTHGIALYVDGKLLTSSNSSVNTLQPSVTGTLTIGKSTEVTHTTLMITGLQIWSASREILLQANILTTTLTTTHSSLSTTNVGTHSTAGSIKTTDMLKSSTNGASWKSTSKAVNTNTPPMKTTDKVTIATNGSTTKLDTYTTAGSMKTIDMLTSLTNGASGESTSTTANTNTAATTTGAMKTTDKVTLSTNGSNIASSTSSSSDASASTPSSSISTKTTETILSTNEHNSASVTASSIASVTPTTTGPTNPIDASVSSTTRPNISSATSASSTGSTIPQTPTHMISIPANSISSKSTSVLSTKGSVTSETSTVKYSKPDFHTYTFSFTNISGQVIIAGKYTLEAHGNLTLVQLPTGQHAIKVNSSKGEYIQIHNQNITCIDTMSKCNHGLTVQVGINFITHDNSSRTYIISSGSQNTSSTGLYLYYHHNSFHLGFTYGTLKWSASVKYETTTNVWNTYQLTWSHTHGIALYVDGTLLTSSNSSVNTSSTSVVGTLTIGKSTQVTRTTLVITGLQIWSASREILLQANVLTTVPTMPSSTVTINSSLPTTKSNTPTTQSNTGTIGSSVPTTKSNTLTTAGSMNTKDTLLTSQNGTHIASVESTTTTASAHTPTTTVPITQTGALISSTHGPSTPASSASSTNTPTTSTSIETTKTVSTTNGLSIASSTYSQSASFGNSPTTTNTGRTKTTKSSLSSTAGSALPSVISISQGVSALTSATPDRTLSGSTNTISSKATSELYTKASVTSETSTVQLSTVKQPIPVQSYNFMFTNISGNVLIAGKYVLEIHGSPTLVKLPSGENGLKLNSSKGDSATIPSNNITCLNIHSHCTNGMTVQVQVNISYLDNSTKTYIISNSGTNSTHTGMYLYYLNHHIHFGSVVGNRTWSGEVKHEMKINISNTFQLSWSLTHGLQLYIDETLVKVSNTSTAVTQTLVQRGSVTIGNMHATSHSIMVVLGLQFWSASRQVLVDNNILTAPAQPTTAAPTPSTAAPSTSTVPAPTKTPIVSFNWNLTSITTTNQIVGNKFNLTVHGQTPIKDGGVEIHNATQYIDFGNNHLVCVLNPGHCPNGLTIQFHISLIHIEENTHILTSGGQLPDGVGIAVIYRYGRIQFVLSTTTQSWFASCGIDQVKPDGYHTIMLSWHTTTGLEIFVDNTLVDTAKVPTVHTTSITHVTNVYFGKQPTTTVSVDYILQSITIWYVHVDILVHENICKPPVRPTAAPATTAAPGTTRPKATATTGPAATTVAATRPKATATTAKVTDKATAKPPTSKVTPNVATVLPGGSTQAPQCPVGCVSVSSTPKPAAPTTNRPATPPSTHAHATATSKPHQTTGKATSKPKPTTTRPKATATTARTSAPSTATPGPQIPSYTTKPQIQVHVDTDSNLAFLACMFNGAIQTNVDITASLLVNGKVVMVKTVKGQTGIAMFAVTKVNMNLYKKQIKCSVSAHFVGSSITTQSFISNTIVPQFTVRPGHVIVIEGHSTQSVVVTSTAPPQFYCCQGCKGDCHVHVVGSFHYDRHDQKCDNKVISQALIVSNKPPMYNKPICGFALTVDNWNKNNKIEIKATLDLRRDGDHTRQLDIVAHVYNQPSRAQITVRPSSLTITTVQVTAKDNDHSATCKSVNDPHMGTFDGMTYNNMNEGEFILYRHTTLPFEVRTYYKACNRNPRHNHATCNCAVAIKSGDDVISVIGCQGTVSSHGHPGQGHGIGLILQQLFGSHGNAHGHNRDELAKTPMTIQIYKNGELTPGTIIRRYGCGQKYEIQLPTGTIVTVQQSYKPFINVWVKASTSDRGHTEGLCGNYDGNRHNDLKPSTNSFISKWKVTAQQNFLYGVSVSGRQVTSTYCSCVKGKESVCVQGVGVMYCARTSRNDITATLVRQAKAPVLARHKRQAEQAPTPTAALAVVEPDGTDYTLDEARDMCEDSIMNSTATKTCGPILTSNLTHQIDQCVYDYNATNSMEWAKDALRDIIVECVDKVADLKAINESGNATEPIPDNLDAILTAACVEDCGKNGECADGVCQCKDGYSGIECTISKDTKPTVSPVPYLCDIAQTADCSVAVVLGLDFVESDTLICHFQYIQVGETVTIGAVMDQVPAVYISLNQVMCRLPQLQSAYIRVSNNGQTQSDEHSVHVPYNSACYDCTISNTTTYTPLCTRKTDSCVVDGVCYASGAKKTDDSCQMCRPGVSDSSLSLSNAAACVATPVKQTGEKMERTQIIILAVVCAVFGVLLIAGIFYICRSRSASTKKTAEFGEYDLTTQKLHREQIPTTSSSSAASNPAYDDKM